MSTVPSVNPEPPVIADTEGSNEAWIDPIFADQNPGRMSDEPAPADEGSSTDDLVSVSGMRPATEDQKQALTREQLDKLLEAEDKAKTAADGEAGEDTAGEDGKAAEAAAKAAEAAKADAKAKEAEDSDDEDGEGEEGEDPPADAGGKKPRRRSRARRERRETARTIARLEGEVDALKAMVAGTKPAEDADAQAGEDGAAEEAPAPTLEDHDYDTEAWAAAYAKWTEEKIAAVTAKAEEAKRIEARKAEDDLMRETLKAFAAREEAARDRIEDYDDFVKDPHAPIPTAAAHIIYESEVGPEIAYYLATNPEESVPLFDMTDIQVARKVGLIEAKILAEQAPAATPAADTADADTADTENTDTSAGDGAAGEAEAPAKAAEEAPAPKPKPQPRPNVTQAPEPMPTVSGGASPTRDPARLSMDEYAAGRRSGKIR